MKVVVVADGGSAPPLKLENNSNANVGGAEIRHVHQYTNTQGISNQTKRRGFFSQSLLLLKVYKTKHANTS